MNDVYPLPLIEVVIETLKGKKYFTLIDLRSGYWQCPISEFAKRFMAMITSCGIFQYEVLPFGVKNAPLYFQRTMNNVLKEGLGEYCLVYIDDIVVFSDTFEKHIKHLNKVFHMLDKVNLKVNIEKCNFALKQLRLLGKVVNGFGVTTDPTLIKDMVEFPRPKTARQVKQFLALLGYYRHFIEGFQYKAAPLYKLTHDDTKWVWDEIHEKTFIELKNLMITAPILIHPDWTKEFHIATDASKIGIGGILSQADENNKLHPVAYFSKVLTTTQQNYSTTEREMLALVEATRKWKSFLFNRRFEAFTDHQPLTGLWRNKDPHGRMARWQMELAQFQFNLKYLKGKLNVGPDFLSRIEEDTPIGAIVKVLAKSKQVHHIEELAAFECDALPSDEEWLELQRKEKPLLSLINYLKSKILPDKKEEVKKVLNHAHNFELDANGILVRITKVNPYDLNPRIRRVVPKSLRQKVVSLYHDNLWSGSHMGRDKTYLKLKQRFYFENMFQYVCLYVSTCPTCQSIKR